jgi:hypothetical protein
MQASSPGASDAAPTTRIRTTTPTRPASAQIMDSSHGSSGVVAMADFGLDFDEPASAARSIACISVTMSRCCLINAANAGPVVLGSSIACAIRFRNAEERAERRQAQHIGSLIRAMQWVLPVNPRSYRTVTHRAHPIEADSGTVPGSG